MADYDDWPTCERCKGRWYAPAGCPTGCPWCPPEAAIDWQARAEAAEARLAAIASALGMAAGSDLAATVHLLRAGVEATQARAEAAEQIRELARAAQAEGAEAQLERLRAAVRRLASTLRDRARDIDQAVGYYDDRASANRYYGKADGYRAAADDIADLLPPAPAGEASGDG
jgi:hypothetical protein